MEKLRLLAAVFFFLALGVLSADEQITKGLDYSLLVEGKWSEDTYEEPGFVIDRVIRDKDGKYRFDLLKEGHQGSGFIIIEGNTLKFAPLVPGSESNLSPTMNKFLRMTGTVWRNTSTFNCHEYIKLMPGGIYLWNRKKPIKEGDSFTYRGIPIVVVMKMGHVNDGVKVRVGPSTSDKPVDLYGYESFRQRGYKKGQTFIKKNDQVYVLGRTPEKEKIDEWNNYWFLVALPDRYMQSYVDADRAWAYGEFIDLP